MYTDHQLNCQITCKRSPNFSVLFAIYHDCTLSLGITDRIDFMRDIFAYIIVVAAVVGVAFDGDVSWLT